MLVTQLFRTSITHFYFDRTMIEREKAKSLALGGIDLAISILAPSEEKKEEKTATPNKEPEEKIDQNIALLKKILPTLNHWQTYALTEATDGIDGEIKLCITCEDGKININQFYDVAKKKFVGEGSIGFDGKKFCKSIFSLLKKWADGKDLFEVFEKFLKQRQYKLNDVTELLFIKEFQQSFKTTVFYEAPPLEETKKEQRPVYLTDIFTIWSAQQKINPWLLSDSIAALLGFKRAEPGDTAAREKEVDQVLKGLKTVQGDLKTVWEKVLQKLYGKELKAVPNDITTALAQQFEAKTFGVLCDGTVGHITQKLFAIIERQDDPAVPYTVKKLYWL